MSQLQLPFAREVLGGSCAETGRHVCDPAYLWCDACPELEWLGWALEALHEGDLRGAGFCLSRLEQWAGWRVPVSGLAGRMAA